jgi:hypothetical protein
MCACDWCRCCPLPSPSSLNTPSPHTPQVMEVVEFLKDPKTFSRLGARPPKGILLEGDPGGG